MEEGRSAIIEIGRDTATTSSSSIIAAVAQHYRKGADLVGCRATRMVTLSAMWLLCEYSCYVYAGHMYGIVRSSWVRIQWATKQYKNCIEVAWD